ncbi:MAG: hypothetical protein ABI641_08830 [Caldimonas sp.]
MKTSLSKRLGAAALGCSLFGSALAQSSGAGLQLDSLQHRGGPRALLYWQLPLDATGPTRPSYGLRLESSPMSRVDAARLPVVDLRFDRRSPGLSLAGVPLMHLGDGGSSDSSMSDWTDNPYWLVIIGGAAAAGLLCVTHTVICRHHGDNNNSDYTPPGTGPGAH